VGSVLINDTHPMHPCVSPFRPAPLIVVAVRHRDLDEIAYIKAFLDVGADVTQLAPWAPLAIEDQMGSALPPSFLRIDDKKVQAYDLVFSFDEKHWFSPDGLVEWVRKRRKYLGQKSEDILIGRDLLWQFNFCCNGPKEAFSLRHPEHC
jgi:hypothetical protein